MSYILQLDDRKASLVSLTGGKGASLARLLRSAEKTGCLVPRGFVVTSRAAEVLLHPHQELLAKIEATPSGDHERLSELHMALVERLVGRPMPSLFAAILAHALNGLGAVAVRSSATCEDSSKAAFAGQHDTYLNQVGEREVTRSLLRCLASFYAPEAVIYRREAGLDGAGARMAVVVQQMVDCDTSGVAFNLNPVTGALSETVINANFGLGESVVGGEADVDQFIHDRVRDEIVERSLAAKTTRVVRDITGIKTVSAPADETPSLSDQEVAEISHLCAAVSDDFGYPQDIEWGYSGGELYLLQARPITRLPERLTRDESAERFPNAVTPMTWGLVEDGFHRSLKASFELMGLPELNGKWFVERDFYIYGNQTAVELYHRLAGQTGFGFDLSDEGVKALKVKLLEIERFAEDWQVNLERYVASLAALEQQPLEGRPLAEQWAHVEAVNETCAAFFEPNIAISLFHTGLNKALGDVASLLLGEERGPGLVEDLKAGIETRTAHINRSLLQIGGLVAGDPALRDRIAQGAFKECSVEDILDVGAFRLWPDFERDLADFVRDFGHREVDFDPYHAPWGDAPEVLFAQILAVADIGPGARKREVDDHERAFLARQELLAATPDALRFVVSKLIDLVRHFESLDDLEHYSTSRVTRPIRRALLAVGSSLAGQGLLADPRDIWMVSPEAMREALAADRAKVWRQIAKTAKANRKRYEAARVKEPVWDPGAVEITRSSGAFLKGLPGSAGQVEGEVFVLYSTDDFARFPKGAILVARTTSPTWTPLFYRAAAVITASGGPLSHGAVTAREVGIPAVMNVREALAKLTNGLRVRVDGTSGEVSLLGTDS